MIYIQKEQELYHYGVKGMKWGVRKEERYANRSTKWAAKEENRKTRFGKNIAGDRKIKYAHRAEKQAAINKDGSVKNRIRQNIGLEALERQTKVYSEVYDMKAKRARTKLAKNFHSAQSYNTGQLSAHYSRSIAYSPKTIKRGKYAISKLPKVPAKTVIRGKNTTHGKRMIKIVGPYMALHVAEIVIGIHGY